MNKFTKDLFQSIIKGSLWTTMFIILRKLFVVLIHSLLLNDNEFKDKFNYYFIDGLTGGISMILMTLFKLNIYDNYNVKENTQTFIETLILQSILWSWFYFFIRKYLFKLLVESNEKDTIIDMNKYVSDAVFGTIAHFLMTYLIITYKNNYNNNIIIFIFSAFIWSLAFIFVRKKSSYVLTNSIDGFFGGLSYGIVNLLFTIISKNI